MPMPVFVVDKDVNVLECNAAAARLFKPGKRTRRPRRAGDILHCLHTTDSPKECGHASACSGCGLRQAVRAASRGRAVKRHQAEMDLLQQGKPTKVNLRVSCQPFTYDRNDLVLLVLEGLND